MALVILDRQDSVAPGGDFSDSMPLTVFQNLISHAAIPPFVGLVLTPEHLVSVGRAVGSGLQDCKMMKEVARVTIQTPRFHLSLGF
jgi:hypothetical protein